MGKIIQPGEVSLNGPWLLGHEDLEALDPVLNNIEKKLKESLKREIENAIEDLKNSLPEDRIDKRIELLKSRLIYTSKQKKYSLTLKDANELVEDSIQSIIKQTSKLKFTPEELKITIQQGAHNTFQFQILTENADGIEYKVKCFDEDIKDDILEEMEKWTRNRKPKKATELWLRSGVLMAVFSGLALLTAILIYLGSGESTQSYKSLLMDDAHKMISNGIPKDSLQKAVDLLLRITSEYRPKDYKPKIIYTDNSTELRWCIYFSIIFTIVVIRPRTTIGIGKKSNRLKFYKVWIWVIQFGFPIYILWPIFYSWLTSHFV